MKNNFPKILIFLSVIIFALACFVFVFLYKETNQNNQKAESETAAWQAETDRRNDITALDASLMQVSNDRTALDNHFIRSSDVVPFLNTIEQLGSPAGASVSIDSVETGTNNNELVVNLKTTGTFEQVYKFLTLLENSQYEINFNSMDMHESAIPTVPTKKAQASQWEGDFEIQLLSFTP